MFSRALCWVVLAVTLVAQTQLCRGAAHEEARRIFAIAESATPKGKSRLEIQARLLKAEPKPGAEPEVRMAFTTALIHERKYADALSAVTSLVAEQPKSMAPRRAKAWLLLVNHKPTDALVEIEALAGLLEQPAKDPLTIEERLAAAQFMGAAISYCEGPAASIVKKTALAQCKTRTLESLTTEERAAFEQSAIAVSEQHAMLQGEGKQLVDAAKAKQFEATKAARAKKEEADQLAADAKVEADKIADKLTQDYEKLEGKYHQANQHYQKLEGEMSTARVNYSNQLAQLASVPRPVIDRNGRTNPSDEANYRDRTYTMNNSINQLKGTITRLAESMERQQRLGQDLERQRVKLEQEGLRVGAAFAQKADGIRKKQIKTTKGVAIASKPVGKATAVTQKQKSYITYDDFPYEDTKTRLLASLAKRKS